MQTGRKILNLRCDRKVSQQDLARACDITPSALSKIEAGINSPRANIIWKIARNLGVTVEYLLDEAMPYPYRGHGYRNEALERGQDPDANVRMDVTREEKAFLKALRECPDLSREIAFAIPESPLEKIRLMHFLVNHATVDNPTRRFLKSFETLLTTGEPSLGTATEAESADRARTASDTSRRAARASGKKTGASKSVPRRGGTKRRKKKGPARRSAAG